MSTKHKVETWLRIYSAGNCDELCDDLAIWAVQLATDVDARVAAGKDEVIWVFLYASWAITNSPDCIEEHSAFLQNLLRFTRNLVAGQPESQEKAFKLRPHVLELIRKLTTFATVNDPSAWPLLSLSLQVISNIITGCPGLCRTFWAEHAGAPEEGNAILRALQTPNYKTLDICFIVILNCLLGDNLNPTFVLHPASGRRTMIIILDRMEAIADSEPADGSIEASIFNRGYKIFEVLLSKGFAENIWKLVSSPDLRISPSNIIFLKVLDAYQAKPPENSATLSVHFLINVLDGYLQHCIESIHGRLSAPPGSKGKDIDPIVARLAQGVMLCAHCINAVVLLEKDGKSPPEVRPIMPYIKQAKVIERVIELLRLLDLILPQIILGQAIPKNKEQLEPPDTTGFGTVKRDLVRFLGIISDKDKEVQDRIRECDGLEVILSLCVTDERNPYLREHAQFALHNLTQGNPSNVEAIAKLQPPQRYNENGELKRFSTAKND